MKLNDIIILSIIFWILLFAPIFYVSANENQIENAEMFFKKGFNDYFRKNPDYENSLKFLLKSSELNYAPANYLLGQIYESGKAVQKNLDKAISYYKLSSNGNYVQANFHLAKIYLNSTDQYYNPREAIRLLTSASSEKPDEAFYYLGMIYEHGNGVDININEALKYYDLSASYDYLKSQEALGRIYESDDHKELSLSLFWYSIAAKRHGSVHSKMKLNELEMIVGEKAVTSISNMVENWMPIRIKDEQ